MNRYPLIFSRKPATREIATFRQRTAASVILLGALATGFIAGRASAESPDSPEKTVTYYAQPGDTLWGIASQITDGDPRPVVDELEEQRRIAGDPDPVLVSLGEEFKIPKR